MSNTNTTSDKASLNGHSDTHNHAKEAQSFFLRVMNGDYEIIEGYPELGLYNPYAIEVVDAYSNAYHVSGQDKVAANKAASLKYRELLRTDKDLVILMSAREYAEKQGKEEAEQEDKRTHTVNGKKVFRLVRQSDIMNFPDPVYLINKIIQSGSVAMIFGESSTGKTFFALHTAECVARGREWFGRRLLNQGRVLYVYAEGKLGLKKRIKAWDTFHEVDDEPNIDYITFPTHLRDERQTILDTIESLEEKPILVVIDTYSNCTVGMNQVDQTDVSTALSVAHEIADNYGCAVLIVHHTNKQGTFNGSQAFKNHVDTMLELSCSEPGLPIILRCEKQRDDDPFDDIKFKLEVVEVGLDPITYEPVTSCALTLHRSKVDEAREDQMQRAKAEQEREERVQKVLSIIKMHGSVTTNKLIDACKDAGISKRQFYDECIIDKLINRQEISCETGKNRTVTYSISRSGL